MAKRILIACFEVPGWGGASTSSYKLFELMRRDGLDVSFLNIIDEKDAGNFQRLFGKSAGNPAGLSGVLNCFLRGPISRPHEELPRAVLAISPDITLAIGWIAALLIKRAVPERNLIYLTSGCETMKRLIIELRFKDCVSLLSYLSEGNSVPPTAPEEREAVILSDYVMTHSELVHDLYVNLFKSSIGKICNDIIWYGEWIHEEALAQAMLARPFKDRDIDVLAIANDWSRPEKNYKGLEKIAEKSRGFNLHIIGQTNGHISDCTHHGLITDRVRLYGVLGRAKSVICPSVFDAAPGVLYEASAMGCNVIASKNCGNWQVCHSDLLVEPFNTKIWRERIERSLAQRFDNNMDYFFRANSYQNLVETVLAF